MSAKGVFKINGHDYAPYVKAKTGLGWARENTNDEDAGRDAGDVMHPNVKSHQRKLTLKLGPMPFETAQQLEADLQGGDDGVQVQYPDLLDGVCTACFTTPRSQRRLSGLLMRVSSWTIYPSRLSALRRRRYNAKPP